MCLSQVDRLLAVPASIYGNSPNFNNLWTGHQIFELRLAEVVGEKEVNNMSLYSLLLITRSQKSDNCGFTISDFLQNLENCGFTMSNTILFSEFFVAPGGRKWSPTYTDPT